MDGMQPENQVISEIVGMLNVAIMLFNMTIYSGFFQSTWEISMGFQWLVAGDWNMTFIFFHVLGSSSSHLTFIFFRGVENTHQEIICMFWRFCGLGPNETR